MKKESQFCTQERKREIKNKNKNKDEREEGWEYYSIFISKERKKIYFLDRLLMWKDICLAGFS